MTPHELDVFIASHDPSVQGIATTLVQGLSGRGFCVHPMARQGDAVPLEAIEEAPDFVVILTPQVVADLANPADLVRLELAHALRCGRIVVPVCLPGVAVPAATALPEDIKALAAQRPVRFDPEKVRQSIALVAHSLSSDAEVEDRKLMRRARIAAGIVVVVFVGVVASFVVPAVYRLATAPKPKPPLPPFSLSWAGFGQRTNQGQAEPFDVADRVDAKAGDRLKLIFSPSARGFAYVLAKNARGEVSVLFPTQALRGASAVEAGTIYEVPAGREWLPVGDDAAPVEIYVIAGYDPLENLEELAEEPDARTTWSERADLLDSTMSGLMDGRHAPGVRYARTRGGHTIDPGLSAPPGSLNGQVTLDNGTVLRRPLVTLRGAISSAVDIRIQR